MREFQIGCKGSHSSLHFCQELAKSTPQPIEADEEGDSSCPGGYGS